MSKWVRGLRRFAFIATVSCIVLALASSVAHAQTFNITNLTNNTASKSSFPSLVDAKGNSYLAWVDTAKGIVVSSQFDGTKFNMQATVQGSLAVLPAFQPQMAVYNNAGATPIIAITWAALNQPLSTPTAPVYDVYESRSDDGGVTFPTIYPVSGAAGPVPLADTSRLAFDSTGNVNVVWGRFGVWISQQAGIAPFGAPTNLLPANTSIDTGGPRIAVDGGGNIFVAWTDILALDQAKSGDGNYCTTQPTNTNATFGGNVYMNQTQPASVPGGPINISATNTRNLSNSNTDWNLGANSPDPRFQVGFFGCSFDNLILFTDTNGGAVHLLWSDEQPEEDILFSKPEAKIAAGLPHSGDTSFSFPINLANLPAASPNVTVVNNGSTGSSYYIVWSGGPTGGNGAAGSTNSQGIFFVRTDDGGNTFTSPELSIADPSARAPAYPQVAVDSSGNVSVAWEQVDQTDLTQSLSTSDTFHVFFAHSTDRGKTFPTVVQLPTDPSVLCFKDSPTETTPDNSTCGTIQIGVDANSNPDLAWVSQASGATTADIDFATTNLTGALNPDFSLTVSPNPASVQPGQNVNFTVNATATGTLPGPITLTCNNLSASAITCSPFSQSSINGGQSATFSVAIPGTAAQGTTFTFTLTGTSGTTTHRVLVTMTVGTPQSPGSVSPTSASLSATTPSANFTVTVNPSSFSGNVNFSCQTDKGAQLPSWLTCTFNPNPLNTSQSTTDTLTITRTGTPTSAMFLSAPRSLGLPGFGVPMVWSMAITTLCLMSMMLLAVGRRQRLNAAVVMRGLLVMTLTIVLAAGLVSCGGSTKAPATSGPGGGGGTGGGSTPVSVNVVVMAQSGSAAAVSLGTVAITAQ